MSVEWTIFLVAAIGGFAGAGLWMIFWRVIGGLLVLLVYAVAVPLWYYCAWRHRDDKEARARCKFALRVRLFVPANRLRRSIFSLHE